MGDTDKPQVPKSALDMQKMKLEKLMMNPDKPVVIPERPKEKRVHTVPEFVRNVMGSSAGAGSGEFHVYRHLRRKEYARQKMIEETGVKEDLDKAFAAKLAANKREIEEKTAKRRAKRLKRKQKLKMKKKQKKVKTDQMAENESSEEDSEDEQHSEESCDERCDEESEGCDEVSANIRREESGGKSAVSEADAKSEESQKEKSGAECNLEEPRSSLTS